MEHPSPPPSDALVARYRQARQDPRRVLLEGFHALKHALRFGARLEHVASANPQAVLHLAERLAPDLRPALQAQLSAVSSHDYRQLAPTPPRTGVIAIAHRPTVDASALLGEGTPASPVGASGPSKRPDRGDAPGSARSPVARPLVLLDHPSDLGNVGAVVRVAAGAGAGGVLCLGSGDPYDPVAVRGSAGLHFALPVIGMLELPANARPLIAADPEGDPLGPRDLPANAVLAFGTEREGLRPALLARADRRLRIPMQAGVSSLNLATSVAIFLYAWRLRGAEGAAGP